MDELLPSSEALPSTSQPSRPLTALAVTLGLWIAGPVVGNILGAIPIIIYVLLTYPGVESVPPAVLLVGQLVVEATLLVVGLGYARLWLGTITWQRPRQRELLIVGGGVGGTLSVWAAATLLSQVLRIESPTAAVTESLQADWALAVFAVLAVTIVPLAEEAIFREAIQRRLRPAVGRWPAILLGTLAFLSIHLFNFIGGSLLGLALAFGTLAGVSIVLGYVYDRTENLLVPVVVHASYNLVLASLTLASLLQ